MIDHGSIVANTNYQSVVGKSCCSQLVQKHAGAHIHSGDAVADDGGYPLECLRTGPTQRKWHHLLRIHGRLRKSIDLANVRRVRSVRVEIVDVVEERMPGLPGRREEHAAPFCYPPDAVPTSATL
jgi:hypothetical protein